MYRAANGLIAALLGALIVLLVTIGVRVWLRSRISPDERERRRRLMLLSAGKMGDANLLDIREGLLIYSYAFCASAVAASDKYVTRRLDRILPPRAPP